MRLILASKSPRRIELLKKLGQDFEIIPSQSPERTDYKRPAARVKDLAVKKAFDVAKKYPAAVVIGADTLGYLSNEHVVQLAKNAKCGFCTACFTGEYAVEPESVLSTDIHDRHLNDRPKDEKKLGE